jgi:hypothetical protein
MKLKIIAILTLMLVMLKVYATDTLGFVSPVDHKVILTGNFMELRSNHFHSGIDIKSTRGVAGDVIRTVHDGYISRIRITSGSYGNALYIDHPNGYTSVYAHLDEFIPEISSYLEDIQYTVESFEVDIYLPDSLLSVVQGQEIGRMGNTGRSFGPHLHFEIRKSDSETPVNPELYGFGPQDSKPPVLEALYIYDIDDNDRVGASNVKYFNPKKLGYELHLPEVSVTSSKVGLGLQMYDSMNGGNNKNGIYSYEMYVDDNLKYIWKADAFSFDDNRKINAFMDYGRFKKYSQKIYLLYQQKCSDFGVASSPSNGMIEMQEGDKKAIKIKVIDIRGNEVQTEFQLTKNTSETVTDTEPILSCEEAVKKSSGVFDVQFDKGAFFSPQNLNIQSSKQEALNQNCHAITIGDRSIPVTKWYTISSEMPIGYSDQWTIITKDDKGQYYDFGADTTGGKLYSEVDQLGEFFIYKDMSPPKLEVINLQSSKTSPWKVRIKDNLIPDGRLDDLSYRATINGQWIRMRYDLKNDVLIFDDFERLGPGPYSFLLVVTDNCGNLSTLKRTIQ